MHAQSVSKKTRRFAILAAASLAVTALLWGMVSAVRAEVGRDGTQASASAGQHNALNNGLTPQECISAAAAAGPPTDTADFLINFNIPLPPQNQAVISYFNSVGRECDGLLFQGNLWTDQDYPTVAGSVITGVLWWNLPSLANATATITDWAPYVDSYGYSIEYGFRTPPEESQNPGASTQAAAQLAADHGLVFMSVPSQLMSNDHSADLAPYTDVYVTQNFGRLKSEDVAGLILQVEDVAASVRAVNPDMVIIVSLSVAEDYDDPQIMYSLAAGLKGVINGIAVDTSGRDDSMAKLETLMALLKGELQPVNNGFIGSNVFLDEDGDGLYNAGIDTPLPGVDLTLNSGSGAGTSAITTTTSITGYFSFDGLAPSSYILLVDSNDFPAGHFTTYPSEPVAVIYNTVITTPIPVYPTYLQGTVFSDDNLNSVYDTGESPLGGVTLDLLSGTGGTSNTSSGGDGVYQFSALVSGDYTITVDAGTLPVDWFSATPFRFRNVVSDSQISGLDFPIQPPHATLSGTVFSDLDSDTLYEPPEDLLLPGVVVSITAQSDGRHYTTTTDGAGKYSFSGLPGDVYAMDVDPATLPPGHYNVATGDKTLNDGAAGTFSFPIRLNQLSGLIFKDFNNNGSFDVISDTVYAGVVVNLVDSLNNVVTATTDISGVYTFRQLTPDTYTASIDPTSLEAGWFSAVASQVRTVVDSSNYTAVNFAVQLPSTVIVGTAYADYNSNLAFDPPDDTVLSGIVVSITAVLENQVITTTTDEHGSYVFAGLSPGTYSIGLIDSSLPPGTYNVVGGSTTLGNGAVVIRDFPIRLNTFAGFVYRDLDNNASYDPPGDTPYEFVVINLEGEGGGVISTTTSLSGTYSFRALAPGTYTATVDAASLDVGWFAPVPEQARPMANDSNYLAVDFPLQLPSGAVGGTVFADMDSDNTQDEGEWPLPGTVVSLTATVGGTVFTAMADDMGDYIFVGLSPGSYTMAVNESSLPPGYYSVFAGSVNVNNTSSKIVGVPVRLNTFSGLVYKDNDLDQTYTPGVDDLYAGADVQVTDGITTLVATSDSAGRYTLRGLAPGSYTATVVESSLADPWFSAIASKVRTVADGSNFLNVDFPVQEPNAILSGNIFGDLDADGVFDSGSDYPLVGVVITLTATDLGQEFVLVTDENGDYQMIDLYPGAYALALDTTTLPPGHYTLSTGSSFSLNNTSVKIVNFAIRVNSLSGLTYRDYNNNSVYNPPSEPVYPDLVINLIGTDGTVRVAVVADDGLYTFRGIPADTYTITVDAASIDEGWFSFLESRTRTVSNNSNVTGMDFPIRFPSAVISGTAFSDYDDNGLFDPPLDQLLPGVTISLTNSSDTILEIRNTDNNGFYQYLNFPADTYIIDVSEGSLPAGHYYSKPAITFNVGHGATKTVSFPIKVNSLAGMVYDDANLNSTYEPGIDTPLPDALVRLTASNGTLAMTQTTGLDGLYAFRAMASDTYTITVDPATLPPGSFSSVPERVRTISSNSNVTGMDFPIQVPAGTITGLVFGDLDADGLFEPPGEAPLPGVVVSITFTTDSSLYTVVTGPDGTYTQTNLSPGTYNIDLADNSLPPGHYNLASGTRVVPNGGTVVFDFPVRINQLAGFLFRDNDLNGNYDPPGDTPYDGAAVNMTGSNGTTVLTATTGLDGNYVFRAIPADSYTVTVNAGSLDPGWFSVVPFKNRTVNDNSNIFAVDFALQLAQGTLTGNVFGDLNGNGNFDAGTEFPLPGVGVSMTRNSDGTLYTAVTDGNGDYTSSGMLPGTYTIDLADNSLPPGHYNTVLGNKLLNNGSTVTFNFAVKINSITGFVFRDNDADGIYTPGTDNIYANVTIDLVLQGGGASYTAISNNSGTYKFRGIPAGTYDVSVDTSTIDPGWNPVPPSYTIVVADDSVLTVGDFAIQQEPIGVDLIVSLIQIKPIRQGTQAGSRIYIIDENDNIVEGAEVLITWTLPDLSTVTGSAFTNGLGRVQFVAPAAGSGVYTITVTDVLKDGMTWTGGNMTSRSTTLP